MTKPLILTVVPTEADASALATWGATASTNPAEEDVRDAVAFILDADRGRAEATAARLHAHAREVRIVSIEAASWCREHSREEFRELVRSATAWRPAPALPVPDHPDVPLIDAEEAVIGGILHEGGGMTALDEVCDLGLEPRDFADRGRMLVYDACLRAAERGELDLTMVVEEARELGADVADLVVELYRRTPSAAHVRYHTEIVLEHSRKRRLARVGQTIAQRVDQNGVGSAALLEEAERMLLAVHGEDRTDSGEVHVSTACRAVLEDLRTPSVPGIPTGWGDVDHALVGWMPGEVTYLGARPRVGKTTFALNTATHAVRQNVPVAFFSLEMKPQRLVRNLLAGRTGIDAQRIRRKELTEQEHARLAEAAADLDGWPLHIVDASGITPARLRAHTRSLVRRHGVKLVVVDYVGLLRVETRSGDPRHAMKEASAAMKRLSGELDVHVLGLVQLNRSCESRKPPRPQLQDLRESGDLEQDADQVLLLYREELYDAYRTPECEGYGEVLCAKLRDGPSGTTVVLGFDGQHLRWTSLTHEAIAEYETRRRRDRGGRPEDTGLRMLILQSVAGGVPMSSGELRDAVSRASGRDVPPRTLQVWCRRLEEEGLIQTPKRGVWQSTEEPS